MSWVYFWVCDFVLSSAKKGACVVLFSFVSVCVCFLGVWDDEDSVKKTSIIVQRNAWCSLRPHHASIGLGLPGFFGATEDESRNIGWLYHLVWLNDSLVYTNVIWFFFFSYPILDNTKNYNETRNNRKNKLNSEIIYNFHCFPQCTQSFYLHIKKKKKKK